MKIYLSLLIVFSLSATCQVSVKKMSASVKSNIRGMSVLNDDVLWLCGNNGMVGKSMNGGKSVKWKAIPGFEKSDFRSIEAIDENIAMVVAVGEPGIVLRTEDGGYKWKVVYNNSTKGIFLDAMSFWNDKMGIIIGDPIKSKFFIVRTMDGGITWKDMELGSRPAALDSEACFASSGTNIKTINEQSFFVTGGKHANIYINGRPVALPIVQGRQTEGANSIGIKDKNNFIVVGGDFEKPDVATNNCAVSKDGGLKWTIPQTPPTGYRSCVEYVNKKMWVTCGLNGVDITKDDGNTWQRISGDSYNVCRKAKKGNAVFLAGANGAVAKLELDLK